MITRTNAAPLIPDQISREILQNVPQQSVFLSLARRMADMTSKQTKVPVMTDTLEANFVSGDTGRKLTSGMSWDNVFITAEELAVIVPIPEAVLADASYDIWAQVRPRIEEAFARAIDAAAFFGIKKPATWPVGIVPGAIAANNEVVHSEAAKDLYKEILGVGGVFSMVEDYGFEISGLVGALKLKAQLRGAVDANKQPIFRTAYSNGAAGRHIFELDGNPLVFPKNGAWDQDTLLLAGDFDMARYAIRQDITYKIFDQGTITDGTGNVTLSLMEQDCVALRATMRLGWQLPKPVHPVAGKNYYPFAVLSNPASNNANPDNGEVGDL